MGEEILFPLHLLPGFLERCSCLMLQSDHYFVSLNNFWNFVTFFFFLTFQVLQRSSESCLHTKMVIFDHLRQNYMILNLYLISLRLNFFWTAKVNEFKICYFHFGHVNVLKLARILSKWKDNVIYILLMC